jgi:SAM-dependent methyltransferase
VTGRRVLELGSGTGELLIEMARRGWEVCGLEPSPAMQRVTGRKMRRRGMWAPRVRGFAEALPFASASLDAVVATFPAGYILSPATWREAARVLRPAGPAPDVPGGRLIIAGLFFEIDVPLLRLAGPPADPFGARMLERCRELAESTGFRISAVHDEAGRFRVPLLIVERCGPTAGGPEKEGHAHIA